MELALTELKLVSVLTARVLEIREAWEEWDIQQFVHHDVSPFFGILLT